MVVSDGFDDFYLIINIPYLLTIEMHEWQFFASSCAGSLFLVSSIRLLCVHHATRLIEHLWLP